MFDEKRWPAIALLYTFSGLTGVAYEILWARMLGLQFGASIFGVVFTVTAFMAGLGLGSLLGASRSFKKPVRFFAILEIGVAIYALFLPFLSQYLSALIESQAPRLSLPLWYSFQGAVSVILLMIPATAMGASFPAILKAVKNTPLSLGKIYGLNTAAASIGALLPLWLLPVFGWTWALRMIAGMGLLVGMAAFFLSGSEQESGENEMSKPPLLPLLPYAGIGAASLMLQVGWTRLYSLVMLRTEYVLALILCVYLVGMGAGSLLTRKKNHPFLLTALPVCAALFTVASLWTFPLFSKWVEAANFHSLFESLFKEGGILVLMTLPVTLCLGAWLPLLHSSNETSGAWLYGINSLGAALGALAAGFVFIPLFGTAATVCLASACFLLFGFYWAKHKAAWAFLPVILLAALPVMHFPQVSRLLPKQQADSRDLFLKEDALSITHVVEDKNGARLLLTDLQRMDASTEPTAVSVQKNQARLPLLLHPHPKSVLFLGLGTGISASGSLPYPELKRTAIELAQGAIDSSGTFFAPSNLNVTRSMTVLRDDARHFLNASSDKYDVIVGDLFHPDLAGAGALLSVEQFRRAYEHLNGEGIFVQWIAVNQFDERSLEVVERSFVNVFADSYVFIDGMHLALVGSKAKIEEKNVLENLARLSEKNRHEAEGYEGQWTWLGRFWGKLKATPGPLQEEWAPSIEFSLPQARFDGNMTEVFLSLLKKRPKVGEAAGILQIPEENRQDFERAYIGSELIMRSWLALLQGDDAQAQKLNFYAYQANPKDRWIGQALADNMMRTLPQVVEHGMDKKAALQKILDIYPDQIEALRALMAMESASGNKGNAETYRMRLKSLLPLDKSLDGGKS